MQEYIEFIARAHDFKENIRYTDDRFRGIPYVTYLRNHRTVRMDLGRQTGKTTAVAAAADMFMDILILASSERHARGIRKRNPSARVRVDVDLMLAGTVHTVIIDEPGLHRNLEAKYKDIASLYTFGGTEMLVIEIGR